jgi:glucans biosynthesis protein
MTHDPMRQADIARRLANLAKARRCGAKTRAGHPCRQAAVKERRRCRMHGGAKGSGGPWGNRNGNFKHGLYTGEAKTIRRVMRDNVGEIKALLQATDPRGTGD